VKLSSLRLTIAVPSWRGSRTVFLTDRASHFHVALENISEHPIRLWSEACSWGYEALSFEMQTPHGIVSIKRKPIHWKQNTPDFILLNPTELQIFDIYCATEEWQHFPLPSPLHSRTILLRAVYLVSTEPLSRQYNVWSGRLTSDWVPLLLVNHLVS